MYFRGTPYNDIIFDTLADKYGNALSDCDVIYSSIELRSIPGCELYSRLLKTTCCLDPHAKEFTQFTLLSLVLMHYKYITVEQYRALMPWATPNLMSLYCKDIRANGAEKENLRKKTKATRKKDIRLNSYVCSGSSFYYMLTKDAYKDICARIPDLYLQDNRISALPPPVPGVHALHQVFTNNTPLRMLRDNKFAPFQWFTNVALNPELTVEYNLILQGEDMSLLANNGSASVIAKKPDGIIVTETSGGTYYCLVEQDMGTEKNTVLNDKHAFYGNLLRKETTCGNVTVLYNSAHLQRDTKLKQRSPNYARQNTYSHALSKLKLLMVKNNLNTIAEARFHLLTEEARKGEGISHGEWLAIKNMSSLIRDYLEAISDRPANDGTIDDVEMFVRRIGSDAAFSKEESIYKQEKPRADRMREGAISFMLSDKGYELREAVFTKALSYVFVNRIAFDRYANALLAKESGYVEELFTRLSNTSLFAFRDDLCYASHPGAVNGFVFRNAFDTGSPDIPVTVFEEISCDVGGYMRARFFADTYEGNGYPMNLVLLVENDEDAKRFAKESKITRFETLDADLPNKRYDVHVAFVNYADTSLPYIITSSGEKRELTKQLKRMEDTLNGENYSCL